MSEVYRVGYSYRDLTSTKQDSGDEFLKWLSQPGAGFGGPNTIGATGGIRPKKFINNGLKLPKGFEGVPSVLIITTTHISQQYHNPWEDFVDYNTGQIIYWGDAKYDEKNRHKKYKDFKGNKVLLLINELMLTQDRTFIPPILHFSRNKKGYVQFSGLCVLDRIETAWFEDKGRPITNLRCILSILDLEECPISWLHSRALASKSSEIDRECPGVWRDYLKGTTQKLFVWGSKMRSTNEQLPPAQSNEAEILEQIISMGARKFEKFCSVILQEVASKTNVQHRIRETRYVKDGGFDFYGRLIFPDPLQYEIEFKGEAKKFGKRSGVKPKDVSRLVARLQRGEYGIFITTSYYTQSAQEEVFKDGYPVRLFSGGDIVNLLKSIGKVSNGRLNKEWFERISS
jgi:hypothetical protein